MKKLILVFILIVSQSIVHADSCATGLMPLFTAQQAQKICDTFSAGTIGTLANNTWATARNAADSANINVWKVDASDETWLNADSGDTIQLGIGGTAELQVGDDTLTFSGANASVVGGATSLSLGSAGSVIVAPANDANRLFTFAAASDTALTLKFGDGTTATQVLTVSSADADASDDSTLRLASGGAIGDSRGAWARLNGNEVASTGGQLDLFGGNLATGHVVVNLEHASSTFIVKDTTSGNLFTIADTGAVTVVSGDINFSTSGNTVALQEATAGAACSGTLTANGATPVVTSTTCATTGSRIFLTRTSAETGVVTAWVSAISTGVSFSITGEAGDTGTYNWLILHEAP